jgi:peptide/nickel transport system ATP-binding protein
MGERLCAILQEGTVDMENNYTLEITDVFKHYTQRIKGKNRFRSVKKTVKAVDGISFELKSGEIMGIIGESGCGKSTLAKLLTNLEQPTGGKILFNGVSSEEMLKNDRLQYKRMIQMVFQNTFDPRNNIDKIIDETLKLHSIGKTRDERASITQDAMEKVGLTPVDDYLHRFPHELSGGQLQRISILRAMLLRPKFLVADEPVSMLDVSVRAEIIKMLQEQVRNLNTALVFISHDINTTRYISDKIVVMYLGRIVESGITDSVLHNPAHPYTKTLISNCASIDILEKSNPIKIEGEPPTPIDNGPGCYFAPRCYMSKDKCFKEYPEKTEIEQGHFASCHFINRDNLN